MLFGYKAESNQVSYFFFLDAYYEMAFQEDELQTLRSYIKNENLF